MRLSRLVGVALALALLWHAQPAGAQSFNQIALNTTTTDLALVTTAETSIIASGPATASRPLVNVCVLAWAQLTTGTNTTGVTPRIRRGTTASGTLVGEGNNEQVKAVAGSTEQFFIEVCEDRSNVASVDYNLTLEQAGASANGSALQATILVLVR